MTAINIKTDLINKILNQFKVITPIKKVFPVETGYRNTIVPLELITGEKLALIIFKNESKILVKIKSANLVSDYLALNNWPTRKTYSYQQQSILKITHQQKELYVCLYNYLDGQTINWESYSQKHLKLLGQTLGKLHQQLQQFPQEQTFLLTDEILNIESIIIKMSNYFSKKNILKATEQKLNLKINHSVFENFHKAVEKLRMSTNSQPLHMDFVRSNILFKNEAQTPSRSFSQPKLQLTEDSNPSALQKSKLVISGIIDFEKTALGPTILDIARTVAFLLVDCKYKRPDKIVKYFLVSGYHKRGNQPLPEKAQLANWIKFYLFHDFYKFLCHNPYEYLPQNEHFVRTKQYLINIGLVSTTINQ